MESPIETPNWRNISLEALNISFEYTSSNAFPLSSHTVGIRLPQQLNTLICIWRAGLENRRSVNENPGRRLLNGAQKKEALRDRGLPKFPGPGCSNEAHQACQHDTTLITAPATPHPVWRPVAHRNQHPAPPGPSLRHHGNRSLAHNPS